MVGAAGSSLFRLGIAAIFRADFFELAGNPFRPVGFFVFEQITSTEDLHGQHGVEPVHQVDDSKFLPVEAAQESSHGSGFVDRHATKHAQCADGEAGVVEIRIALTSAEATVVLLA